MSGVADASRSADGPVNGDMSRRVAVDTDTLDWVQAPGGQVWRRRLHRVGPAEAGQVTSLVRYVPGARFHAHPHPDGEEILVLEGRLGDEHAVSGPGTYLLHPEGFEHAPFSEEGCLLFVKLRQYAGAGREYVTRNTATMNWVPDARHGVSFKTLYEDARFPDRTRLECWMPGTGPGVLRYPDGVEFFVLHGAFHDERGHYGRGHWLRLPPGGEHRPVSANGCRLYVKTGGVGQLACAPA